MWPFLVLLGVGLAVSIGVPPLFPEQRFEIPAFALFPAEIALVMILSVLFFENATPAELLRLSFTMLTLAMFSGTFCNWISKSSQTLPDSTLLLNWVELICMNISGLIATVALYQTRSSSAPVSLSAVREPSEKRAGAGADEVITGNTDAPSAEKADPASGESAKDILDQLDVSRINRLEKQITRRDQSTGGPVSLDSLFAEESHAANKPEAEPAAITETVQATSLDDFMTSDKTGEINKPMAQAAIDRGAPPAPPLEAPTPPPPSSPMSEPASLSAAQADASASIDDLFGDIEIGTDFSLSATTPEPQAPAAANDITLEATTAETPSPVSEPIPAPPSPEPAAAESTSSTAHLFDENHLGGDLEDIFANLAPEAANDEFSPEKLAEIKSQHVEEPPAPAPAAKAESSLFGDGLGDELDSIFDNLAPEAANKDISELLNKDASAPAPAAPAAPAQAPAAPAAPAPAPAAASAEPAPKTAGTRSAGGKEVKEFGRLSVVATAKSELSAPGTLKTIGQMLLDTQAVENIIKRTENRADEPTKITAATARVVSVSRGADIQAMLNNVAAFPGIDGSLVIGKDGLLIGATESLGMMRDVLGVLALGIHSTTSLGTKKVDLGQLHQSIMRTGNKVSILTEVGIGVLACFCDQWKLDSIDAMIDHINSVINESQASGGASLPTESLGAGLLTGSEPTPPPPVAPAPAPAAPKPVEVAVPITDAKGGLLSVSDDDIGGLFDGILSDSSTHNDSIGGGAAPAPAPAAPAPVAAAAPAQATAAAQPSSGGMMAVDDDMMSAIFDNMLEKTETVEKAMDFSPPGGIAAPAKAEAPAEPAKAQPAAAAPAAPAASAPAASTPSAAAPPATTGGAKPAGGTSGKQIKEFGRLSVNTSAAADSQDGAIKAIGRQLIDVQAVENIIKAGEKREKMGSGLTTARVISAARGEGIKALLTKIDGCPSVVGSLIVGNDGLVIASTLQGGMDKDLLGALCTAMHSHAELASKKVELGKLKQIIFHANDKVTILTAVAVGVLAVFVDNHDMNQVDALLTAIEQTVRG